MRDAAMASLLGTAVGDAFGERADLTRRGRPLPDPWAWTDDTEMACSVFHVLDTHGHVDADALAESFLAHHDPTRNYGPGVEAMLRAATGPTDLRRLAATAFGGTGSWGNGGAMRAAPVGAWFTGDPSRAAAEAEVAARVTHTHEEGVAGAVATAVAAAVPPAALYDEVLTHTPPGLVHDGIRAARALAGAGATRAAAELGTGSKLSAPDTVPFALWVVAAHPDDYAAALRTATSAAWDLDTVCAIAGGIIAARTGPEGIPAEWRTATEPLPAWL